MGEPKSPQVIFNSIVLAGNKHIIKSFKINDGGNSIDFWKTSYYMLNNTFLISYHLPANEYLERFDLTLFMEHVFIKISYMYCGGNLINNYYELVAYSPIKNNIDSVHRAHYKFVDDYQILIDECYDFEYMDNFGIDPRIKILPRYF
jgi:hypothetical protein